ncbi:MAG: hypothetical protein INF81_10035 [Roseomonas sp.]|nr:hypothetical protein [Roseomonas sp.]MCA3430223.1 hypothetical protein [Roseomonas sp.]MCA3433324.1 hypothetical protein [Roseomonas sp.]
MSGVFVDLGAGNDTGSGTEFSDTILGNIGNDTFGGFGGNDSLLGGDNDDFINGGNGDDTIYGGTGNDLLLAGAGNDRVFGEGGNDSFLADSTAGGPFAVYFDGGAGDDVFRLYGSADTVIGGAGTDRVEFLAGNQTIDLADLGSDQASGIDHIVLAGTNQALQLSAADVLRLTDSGSLRVSGVTGNSIDLTAPGWTAVTSGGGFTTFTNGTATLLVADNLLGSGEAGQTLSGTEGNDVISLGAGSDSYLGLGGNDSVLGNDGNDTILGGNGGDTVHGSAGDDSISGGSGDDRLFGGLGNDTIDAGEGLNDRIRYTDLVGPVTVVIENSGSSSGFNRATVSTAAQGTDSIMGFEILTTTTGNDYITVNSVATVAAGLFVYANEGNDTLIFNTSDTAAYADYRSGSTLGGVTVDLLAGTAVDPFGTDSLVGVRNINGSGEDDIIYGSDADNRFRLYGGNDCMDGRGGSDLADYSYLGASQSLSVNLATGRANDGLGFTDTLISIENVWGGAGNDAIIGGNGADSLDGGNGADTLDGGSGNDTIAGGDGNDRIFGGTGSDSIDAGTGTSDIISFNHTSAQAVSATISAIGGSGGSNYAVVNSASQGNDTIINFENIQGSFENDGFTINSAATDNALLFVFGSIGADTIAVNIASNAVMADYNTITGSTNFTRGVIVDLLAGTADDGRGGIDSLIGVRGVSGSSFGDTILGSVFNDRFREQGGSDSINGRDGFDMLDYSGNNAGQSVSVNLAAERASDGREGTDTVISMENVRSGSGNDTLIGNAADNELRGGSGADILDGGASGFDIADYANNTSAQAISVNLIAGRASDGFSFNDTLVSIEYIRGGSGNDTMIGSGANERFRGNAGNDTIDGGDGTEDILDLSQTTQSVSANLVTGLANDGLDGTDRFINVEVVYSGTANDILLGSDRNEIFDGGMGSDLIDGGLGADRVRYWNVAGRNSAITRGVSVDLAAERATDGWGGQDTLIGIERVTATDFADTLLGDNVGNRFNGRAGNDSIDGGLSIDWLEYLDEDATSGITVNLTTGTASDGRGGMDIFTSIENVSGQDFADHLTGIAQLGRSTSRLRGGGGNDTLVGMANEFVTADYTDQTMGLSVNLASGSVNDGLGGVDQLINIRGAIMLGDFADTIIGTAGNDWLSPGGGNDTISGGDGLDIISYDGNPTSGVSVNLAAGRASDGDGGTDSLSGIEGIWVSYSNDTVIGDSQGNLIGLGAGADSADAAAGQDTISYSLGFSPNTSVYVFNEAQNQLSFTGVTIDLAAGRATDFAGATDTILNFEAAIGSTMHDSILGSNGNDVLGGAEGNDTINGGGGGDTIYAGAGDVILGGAGDDVVLVGNVTLAEINALFAQWQP